MVPCKVKPLDNVGNICWYVHAYNNLVLDLVLACSRLSDGAKEENSRGDRETGAQAWPGSLFIVALSFFSSFPTPESLEQATRVPAHHTWFEILYPASS